MDSLRLTLSQIGGAAFRAIPKAVRADWLTLLAYCAEVENGGQIAGAAAWTDKQWLSSTHLDRGEVDAVVGAGLAAWYSDGLVVRGYDLDGEAKSRTYRVRAGKAAAARWAPRQPMLEAMLQASSPHESRGPMLQALLEAEPETLCIRSDPDPDLNTQSPPKMLEAMLQASNSATAGHLDATSIASSIPVAPGTPTGEAALALVRERRARRRAAYSAAFEAAWKRYPNGSGKGAAAVAWTKAAAECFAADEDALLARVNAALDWQLKCERWTSDGGRYVPHFATYLNQGRWDDKPDAKPRHPNEVQYRRL